METVLAAARLVQDDVPIAAAIVGDEGIVSLSVNETYSSNNPIGHAEIVAIQEAGKVLGTSRLDGYSLFTNLEPCTMCAGAIRTSRLSRLVFGARNSQDGACGSVTDAVRQGSHQVEVIPGVLEKESAALLLDFFHSRR